MKFIRFISILLISILLTFFAIGVFVKKISYTFTLDIQAPIAKAYNALASHEFKSIQYPNINPLTAKVETFIEGNTTYIEYSVKGKSRFASEKILQKDSLKKVILETEANNALFNTELHFEDKNLLTRVHFKEEIHGKSSIERAMLFFFKEAIKNNKERLYQTFKTRIESTPDFDFRPEEQK